MMVKLLRAGASVLVVAASALSLYRCCVMPYRCNASKPWVIARAERAFEDVDPTRASIVARRSLEVANDCLRWAPDDLDMLMVRALNLRTMGRVAEAVATYQTALRYDRRPEIYLQLGLSQLQLGDRRSAMSNLLTAVKFAPKVINLIDDTAARDALYRQISIEQARLGNLLLNPDFSIRRSRGLNGPFRGSGQGPSSVAAHWFVYNTPPGFVRCEFLPSTRPGDKGLMLHIETNGKPSGLEQVWGTVGTGPAQATTSAWVFVKRGRVLIGSGHLESVSPDAVSKMENQWEFLSGRSHSCPVSQTVIFSDTVGADFYVSGISVTAVPDAPQCNPVFLNDLP